MKVLQQHRFWEQHKVVSDKKFNQSLRPLLASAVLAGLSACAVVNEKETAGEASAIFPPNSYATVMDRYEPLGIVRGADGDDIPTKGPENDFKDAKEIAVRTDSYALLIWRDGTLCVEQYFAPATSELRQETASMHKSVLGLLVAAAIDDGYIASADEPIGQYIPEWANDPRGDIQVRDLLTMSAGLKPLSREGGAQSDAAKYVYNGAAARQTTLSSMLGASPGEVFDYQNLTSQLLVMVLEDATKKPYAEFLSERLWRPLGASEAYVWLNETDGFPRGYSGLLATARDWLRVGLLIKDFGAYGGEQVIDAALIEAMTTPSKANPNYGWQIWLGTEYAPMRSYSRSSPVGVKASEPYLADDMIYFDGFGGQRVYISREEDLVIVRIGELFLDWDDSALPNAVIRGFSK